MTTAAPEPYSPIDHGSATGHPNSLQVTFQASRERAEAIVAQMTRQEKAGLVVSYFPHFSPRRDEFNMPLCSGFTPGISRLGIPDLRITDASLGVANILNGREGETSTALPSALAMAASFDCALVREASAMIGCEARAKTFNVLLAGGINLIRDPWAGRNFEYFSEDPLLSGHLGGAAVAGVQSNNIASTLKHYVLNSQETGRMVADARIEMQALRESDLLAFQIAIEIGGPASVMTAYNKVNGDWASENAPLVNDILKGEWGFPGWVMSDWGGVHSTEKAALAGLDQESGIELDGHLNGAIFFTDRLENAIEQGRVPTSRLNDMAARVLVGLIDSGAMDEPVPEAVEPIDLDAHLTIAQRTAECGIVLLRNEGALPLPGNARRIAVIGGHADVGVLSGGGSSQVRSHGGTPIENAVETGDGSWFCRETYHASSPLEALRALMPQTEIQYCSGADLAAAIAAARDAEFAIVFATQWRSEAADLETLSLPDGQDALIAAISAANAATIVVLETGGAVLMPWLADVAAVLAAWYPGQRGGEAIARVLLGQVNPSGRLPITFPANDRQAPRPLPCGLPELRERDAAKAAGDPRAEIAPFKAEYLEGANVGYRWHEASCRAPLFPFGFGLSYTRFAYHDAEVERGESPRVRVTVANEGDCAGSDVLQVYVQAPDSQLTPTWRLAGFSRVALDPGCSQRVEIILEPRTYSVWDDASGCWAAEAGLAVALGRSANDRTVIGAVGSD